VLPASLVCALARSPRLAPAHPTLRGSNDRLLGVIWWNATDTTARILGRVSVALCAISCCVSMFALGVYLIIVLALVCC